MRWVAAILTAVGALALDAAAETVAQARVVSRPFQKAKAKKTETPGKKVAVAGPLQLVISLHDQKIAVFDQGKLIATSRISSGRAGHLTPTGVFTILEKRRFHNSNIYSNAPMPFMQRITYSGIALHEGILPGYAASHGCIRLPRDFAAHLFGMSSQGTRVIVSGTAVAPRFIAHPRLFSYRPKTPDTDPDGRLPEDVALFWPSAIETALSSAPVRTADASGTVVSRGDAMRMQRLARRRSSPVSVFISRKEGRLFARQRMQPMLESPVTFRSGDTPLGTHVFTALDLGNDGVTLEWNVVSVPLAKSPNALDAAAALEAIDIPAYAMERLGELMVPGSSLIISDEGLGYETSKRGETDFIVLTK
jgi:hypothetical protein